MITSEADNNLSILNDIANLATKMCGKQGKRNKTLTRDTSEALSHTCHGLVSLAKYLLISSHDYFQLGDFTTDPLEKSFSKLR